MHNRLISKGLLASLLACALLLPLSPRLVSATRHGEARPPAAPGAHRLLSLMTAMRVQPVEPVEVPAFSLTDASGKKFQIKAHEGKVILINFWTTH